MQLTKSVLRYFHPVLPAAKLRRGPVRVTVAGQHYVLFRDGSGQPAALLDACPHRLAPLSRGHVRPDGRLACPYHGWNFDAQGQGQSPSQPSLQRCDVRAFQVREQHGYLWLAERETPASALPQLKEEGFSFGGSFTALLHAPLHVALDNFSEDEHTPFVHTRLGWAEGQVGQIEFSADNFDDRTEVRYRAPQRPTQLLRVLLLRSGDFFHNEWVTRFDPVHTRYLIYWTSPSGQVRPVQNQVTVFMVPETATTTRFHVFSFVKLRAPRLAFLLPMVKRAALWLGWLEVRDDARFIPAVAQTPFDMKGMRLGKYDKPLIHNHKLLRRIYFGEDDRPQED